MILWRRRWREREAELLLEPLGAAAGHSLRASWPCLRWPVMLTNFPQAVCRLWITQMDCLKTRTHRQDLCPCLLPTPATVEYWLAFSFKILDLGVFVF